jgi:DcuC family C4-dicarboxylate transporter
MLIGVAIAVLTSPKRVSSVAATFFEGAGFAFAHVISVITAATMFAESIRVNGLIDDMTRLVRDAPEAVLIAGIVIPWLMATVTGTAVGTAPLVIGVLVPVAMAGSDPTNKGVRVGALNAIAAQFGRTSSPVAPVVIMCATLAHSRPLTLVKRIVVPLMCGGVVLLIVALIRSRVQ